ncbi:hypothetical protein TEA_015864 [Camellia sinensis var. sinensis]|uniref:Uncharacterized protein n=1 Tax=Camellia sinensis var. sinensis TaxID=542762 RepID=A0A4S4DEM4_CAMSN|nr:hypothetical protein TEA_015864 [Camellia sinensis var. sinensis]
MIAQFLFWFVFLINIALITVAGFSATEEVKMTSMVDDINAYSYLYPAELPSRKFVFKWVESRKPERYSSAAPLTRKKLTRYCFQHDTADARLRIVSERVDIIDNLIISISIGPPNSQFLKSKDKSTWSVKDVADSVLSDKSALRITSSQRMAESSVLDAHSSEIDGEPYWYCEYLIRKSPTKTVRFKNQIFFGTTFLLLVNEMVDPISQFYYSLLCKHDYMGPFLEKTAASFRLLPPTENYVPPYKDPWRFW